MKNLTLLAAALAATTASPYTLDLGRYFATDTAEQAERVTLLVAADAFEKQPAASLTTPQDLVNWFKTYDSLSKGLQKHDLYVYLRAEENRDDKQDAAADEALGDAITRLDAAVRNVLADVGPAKLHAFLSTDTALARYAYFIDVSVERAAHERQSQQAVMLLAQPALASLGSSYKALRQRMLAAAPVKKPAAGQEAYAARWAPYIQNEDSFAALLLPLVSLQNGKAKLEGFAGAPEAAYFRAGLSATDVRSVLAAVRISDANKRYLAVVAAAAATQLHVAPAELHHWNLDAADGYTPTPISFTDAVPLILAAEQPMGSEYAGQYAQLFDPTAHRVEWCHAEQCDDTGFSVGYAGMTSGLFYGNYQGSTDSVRAVAHEAGHAVHRQLMNENQTLAVYNEGPHFVFESFAIFNELLLLDHLYKTAPTPAAKAYYLHQFLDDVTFQVYGSAQETDLEESIYAGVKAGDLRTAKDLDALTLQVFSRYTAPPDLEPEERVYWTRNRLYYTDPFYDVNYLFAGLLALEYLRRYEDDPQGFARGYVALLKSGFTDTPQALESKFLGIDMHDAAGLVGDASALINKRTAVLAGLYAGCGKDAVGCSKP